MLMRNTLYWYINSKSTAESNYISLETQILHALFQKYPFIYTDSRIDGQQGIFFALQGQYYDGNQFAEEALKTASYAVVDDPSVVKSKRYILVPDSLKTLQNLATLYRAHLKIPIIGITGSNGKTTTKELVAAVLSKEKNVFATTGNLNNQIGVPLSILQITQQHEMAVIEMGASKIDDIEFLCKIVKPDYGIITNIGRAHLSTFGSFENVIMAKSKLYRYLRETGGTAFINNEDKILDDIVPPPKTISYGTSAFTHLQGFLADDNHLFVNFYWVSGSDVEENNTLSWIEKNRLVKTKIVGKHNFTNLLAAITVGKHFGIDDMLIKNAIEEYAPKNSRSQYKKTPYNEIIIDCYNANPVSMKAAITNFVEMPMSNKVLIIGDMLELGKDTIVEHELIISIIKKYVFKDVFLIGKTFNALQNSDEKIKQYPTTNDFIAYLRETPLKGNTILLKGSRGVELENVIPFL